MLLGDARVGVVLCPTTEADLGDGIGPARALADAGARLAIGSDQNAVIDPLLELRGLEAGERLARQARGVLAPDALWAAGGRGGYAALGLDGPGDGATGPGDGATGPGDGPPGPGLRVGDWCDLVELDAASARTVGSADLQLVLTATAADVLTTVVGGSVVTGADPAALLAQVLPGLGRPASVAARGPRTHEERA